MTGLTYDNFLSRNSPSPPHENPDLAARYGPCLPCVRSALQKREGSTRYTRCVKTHDVCIPWYDP